MALPGWNDRLQTSQDGTSRLHCFLQPKVEGSGGEIRSTAKETASGGVPEIQGAMRKGRHDLPGTQ